MRILHISEAYGGGVASSVASMVAANTENEHHLLARYRPGVHIGNDALKGFSSVQVLPEDYVRSYVAINRAFRHLQPDVLHAHSSIAGILTRASKVGDAAVVYSPHCFASERTDVNRVTRLGFEIVERVFAKRTTAVAAVSPHEASLARTFGCAVTKYVPNRAENVQQAAAQFRLPVKVFGAGRLCAQKDWRMFARIKQQSDAAGILATWTWLGGGSPYDEEELRSFGIRVTGWLPRPEVLQEMSSAQVYLHTAAWEGAPMSVIEAAESRLPIVARSIATLISLGVPGLVGSEAEAVSALRGLSNEAAWLAASGESAKFSSAHSLSAQSIALAELYDEVVQSGRGVRRRLFGAPR